MELNAHQAYLILLGAGVKKVNGYHLSPSIFKEEVAREVVYRGHTIRIAKLDDGKWVAKVDERVFAAATPAAAQRMALQFLNNGRW